MRLKYKNAFYNIFKKGLNKFFNRLGLYANGFKFDYICMLTLLGPMVHIIICTLVTMHEVRKAFITKQFKTFRKF